MQNKILYSTPVGVVLIEETDGKISGLYFKPEGGPAQSLPETAAPGAGALEVAGAQLHEYFSGKRREFDLPLSLDGTDFQKRVWRALLEIPYGETRTYGQIAAVIGSLGAARAVGLANNRNKISIFIPCHRVVGAGGRLVGYGGGLENKEKLLLLEGALPPKAGG